jgi:putative pyruvate formate lyase activating enzyme
MNAQLLETAIPRLRALLEECCLCGHRCGVNRIDNVAGFCRTASADAEHARVASHTLHFGEEPVLVGRGGSGTVFFAHCNLRCVFCQNYQISQMGMGDDLHYTELAEVFIDLQARGAVNLNLVTPTHYAYPILLALRHAAERGFHLPVVYNTNGFDSVELLAILDGIVDIYLPDMKYMDAAPAHKYSSASRYPETAKLAILEMFRQVGPIQIVDGIARKGVIIRHLVLPENLSNTYDFLLWLKDAAGRDERLMDVTLSLMSQYSPQHRALEFPELRDRIPHRDYVAIVEYALDLGFNHLLTQGIESSDVYLPDFRNDEPFTAT